MLLVGGICLGFLEQVLYNQPLVTTGCSSSAPVIVIYFCALPCFLSDIICIDAKIKTAKT
jgi:hypothetical protein